MGWKLFCLGEELVTYLGEVRVCLWNQRWEKLHRLTIKWTSSKIVFKDFPNTFIVPSTDCFKSIASHKKCIFLNVSSKLFLKNYLPYARKPLKNYCSLLTFLKMLLFHRYFLTHFKIISKRFLIFFKVLPVHFNEQLFTIHVNTCFYTPNEGCRFSTQ